MSLNIEIDEKWVITSDRHNLILNEKKIHKYGKNTGKTYHRVIGYYPYLGMLISSLIKHNIRQSVITSLTSMDAEIKRIGQVCLAAFEKAYCYEHDKKDFTGYNVKSDAGQKRE